MYGKVTQELKIERKGFLGLRWPNKSDCSFPEMGWGTRFTTFSRWFCCLATPIPRWEHLDYSLWTDPPPLHSKDGFWKLQLAGLAYVNKENAGAQAAWEQSRLGGLTVRTMFTHQQHRAWHRRHSIHIGGGNEWINEWMNEMPAFIAMITKMFFVFPLAPKLAWISLLKGKYTRADPGIVLFLFFFPHCYHWILKKKIYIRLT